MYKKNLLRNIPQVARAVEYADCIFAEGQPSPLKIWQEAI